MISTQIHTLPELIDRLGELEAQQHDFIQLGTDAGMMSQAGGAPMMVFKGQYETPELGAGIERPLSVFDVADDAHGNLSARLGIHRDYYDRMLKEKPALLAENVNAWLQHPTDDEGGRRAFLFRTYRAPEGNVLRAVLSDRYAIINHRPVLIATLEAVQKAGAAVEITRCELSHRSMYVTFECPDVRAKAPGLLDNYLRQNNHGRGGGHRILRPGEEGEIIAGFTLRNSETGYSQFEVFPRMIVTICNNGVIQMEDAYAYRHLGKKNDVGEITPSHRTMTLKSELAISQVADAIRAFTDPSYLERIVARLVTKGEIGLAHPTDAIRNAVQEFSYSDERAKRVLDAFMLGGTTNRFALTQAFTLAAHEETNPDTRFDVERDGIRALDAAERFDRPFVEQRRKRKEEAQLALN